MRGRLHNRASQFDGLTVDQIEESFKQSVKPTPRPENCCITEKREGKQEGRHYNRNSLISDINGWKGAFFGTVKNTAGRAGGLDALMDKGKGNGMEYIPDDHMVFTMSGERISVSLVTYCPQYH